MINAYKDPASFYTTIRYRESIERLEKNIYEDIIERIVDKFIEDHYDEIIKTIDIGKISGDIGNRVSDKVSEIMLQEIGLKNEEA